MSQLFSPLQIKDVTLKNRIAVSPMCQYSSEDGFANDWHLVHLGSRAVGGTALVFTEAAAVSPEGRISPHDLGIWKDEHIPFLKHITSFIRKQGAVPGIQLAHAGRKASVSVPWEGNKALFDESGWQTFGPSALPFSESYTLPKEMDKSEINKVIHDFQLAAQRALKAGFKVIELHAAHGYLIHEFLSPLSNQRTDEYGGSFENRVRFLLEIIASIKKVWPETLPLFLRISSTDWKEGGWSPAESVQLASLVKTKGIDLIDCSSGGNVYDAKIPIAPLYQTGFAELVKKEAGILTGAVGMITTSQEANNIIGTGKADLVLMAREFLRDPYFPLRAAHELTEDVKWPIQYERAKRR